MFSISKVQFIKRFLVLLFIFSVSFTTLSPVLNFVIPIPSIAHAEDGGETTLPSTPAPPAESTTPTAPPSSECADGTTPSVDPMGNLKSGGGCTPPSVISPSPPSPCDISWSVLGLLDGGVCYILKYTLMKMVGAGLYLAARSFDLVVNISLFTINTKIAQNGTGTIYQAWSMVRDICNIIGLFFFFVSIFYIIIGKGLETRKYLVKLVLFAILLNFSFPISKAVLDFTNIFALNIYGGITATDDGQYKFLNLSTLYGALGDNAGISNQLMQVIGLQSPAAVAGDIDQSPSTSLKAASGISDTASMLSLIIMAAAVAIVFAQATMVFVSRTVLMFFCIITSPIMFMGGILPPNSFFNLDDWVSNWTKKFFGGAFMAPVMMVNLWLAIEVMKFTKNLVEGNALVKFVLTIITIVVFQKAVEYSVIMVDGIGEKAAALGGKIGGKMMSGLASRPAAFAMRNTVNRGASAVMTRATREGGWLHRQSEKSGAFGRLANSTLKSVDNVNKKVRGSSGNVLGSTVAAASFGKINNLVADQGGLDRDDEKIDILKADHQKAKIEKQQARDQKEGENSMKESASKSAEATYLSRRSDEVAAKVTDQGGFAEQKENLEIDLKKIVDEIDDFEKGNKTDDSGKRTKDVLNNFKKKRETLKAGLDLAVKNGDKDLISQLHKDIKQNKIDYSDYKQNIGLSDLKIKKVKHLESLVKIEQEIKIAKDASAKLNTQSQNAVIDSINAELTGTTKLAAASLAIAPLAQLRDTLDAARAAYEGKYRDLDTATHQVNTVTAKKDKKDKDAIDHSTMEKLIAHLKKTNEKLDGKKVTEETVTTTATNLNQ